MFKKVLFLLIISLLFLINPPIILADRGAGDTCGSNYPTDPKCITGWDCKPIPGINPPYEVCIPVTTQTGIGAGDPCNPNTNNPAKQCILGFNCSALSNIPGAPDYRCMPAPGIQKAFGKIQVPGVVGGLVKNNPTGAGAISQFLTNFIILLYSIAAIVLIFMLVWAAFEWLTSGGDKEKLAAAQKRILHAIIGIILFAVAFAIIRILGVFTGFTFFKEPPKITIPGRPGPGPGLGP